MVSIHFEALASTQSHAVHVNGSRTEFLRGAAENEGDLICLAIWKTNSKSNQITLIHIGCICQYHSYGLPAGVRGVCPITYSMPPICLPPWQTHIPQWLTCERRLPEINGKSPQQLPTNKTLKILKTDAQALLWLLLLLLSGQCLMRQTGG